jgi:DNA-binding NarL/FixJ family response regulator
VRQSVIDIDAPREYVPAMPDRRGRGRAGPSSTTPRQREVIGLVALGLPTKEIASRLGISQTAVKKHLSHLMSHYEVPNRPALVRAAIADGILATATPEQTVTSSLPPAT